MHLWNPLAHQDWKLQASRGPPAVTSPRFGRPLWIGTGWHGWHIGNGGGAKSGDWCSARGPRHAAHNAAHSADQFWGEAIGVGKGLAAERLQSMLTA
eukprot:12560826-Alexandrium_andersonii.AAC.1